MQLLTLHKMGVTLCEVGHFTVDHTQAMGSACLHDKTVENQDSDEEWMPNRNQSHTCLFYVKETSFVQR